LISYANLLTLLEDRKRAIVYQIYNNITRSIKEFSDESLYGVKFDQYSYILDSKLVTEK
jgi:predicted transcriptional regulator